MGHRVGKIVFKGCIRQSAVRSSITSSAKVNTKGRTASQPPTYLSQPQQQISCARNLSTKQFIMSLHMKARCKIYPREKEVFRCPVPDDKVPWSVDFLDYEPVNFTSKSVLSQPVWADPPDPSEIRAFNTVDTSCNVNRKTYEGKGYEVVDGYPRNPRGRTGVTGRGCLGRWGPNHAADPIVTRWKRDENNEIVIGGDGKPVLQFVSVQRRDNGEWALPGGMVDPGENRTATLIREFGEEALNSLEKTDEEKQKIKRMLTDLFVNKGEVIYRGYVDDPRNTDNSWMETKAINFHDDDGTGVGAFQLHAGDDAQAVQWKDIDSGLELYASHKDFIKETVKRRNAHWDSSPV
ncbi:ADP-ribose pyrophosphatase, mitochondrial-like [Ruditapes philippinarum]|uniref:ADP-ribose pyrophosphatase, mitochondrial-like n=1 Tax=Ruditapes philippinarum TaxID=129788 RepID=UPI00295BBC81|nr:ADP-ribose pyrophosphatase, mitochondrial-like [Ruditapes philippinarum]XP_060585502.1 ADP-ribose pyrophosphatase, mitochondrial-like [Ruditapes philippinarum]